MRNILLLFIKNPHPGYVKTRLARTVGDEEALRIYHILLDKTRKAAQALQAERWLYYSDFPDPDDNWPETDFLKKAQHGSDLGARMEAAFREAFDAGAAKVVIIGSDCPELSEEVLRAAFDHLDEKDFALGPTPDGGYYLLGMKQLESGIFHGIEWSTDSVRAKTLEQISLAGKTVAILPMLSDIDTEEDWRLYEKKH